MEEHRLQPRKSPKCPVPIKVEYDMAEINCAHNIEPVSYIRLMRVAFP